MEQPSKSTRGDQIRRAHLREESRLVARAMVRRPSERVAARIENKSAHWEHLAVAQAERAAARLRAGRLPRRGVQAETGADAASGLETRKTG